MSRGKQTRRAQWAFSGDEAPFQPVMPTEGRSPKLQFGLSNFDTVLLFNILLVRLNAEVTTCEFDHSHGAGEFFTPIPNPED